MRSCLCSLLISSLRPLYLLPSTHSSPIFPRRKLSTTIARAEYSAQSTDSYVGMWYLIHMLASGEPVRSIISTVRCTMTPMSSFFACA